MYRFYNINLKNDITKGNISDMKYGIEYLRKRLDLKRYGVLKRYRYYDMKNHVVDFNISTPPELKWWASSLGWCGKAVDSLADRLVFREFKNDNFGINEIFEMNNPDVLVPSAITGALISSCDFIYISEGADGFPRLQVVDGGNATGTLDPITGLLEEGYAVLLRDDSDNVVIDAYFDENATTIYTKGEPVQVIPHNVGHPLLVPIIYKSDASRPFGHSRITRACMSLQDSAIRTLKRSEIASEFYSYPQKYVTGLSEDAEIMDKWRATISTMMTFTTDEDGNRPSVGQFQQQNMTPHVDMLKMFASLFAGETSLTMDDMGFVGANPSSAEALKASHESMRLTARKAQRGFGSGLLNAGYLACCLRDGRPYERSQFYLTSARWNPIFEPDAGAMSGLGDALLKIEQAVPGTISTELLEDLTGFTLE